LQKQHKRNLAKTAKKYVLLLKTKSTSILTYVSILSHIFEIKQVIKKRKLISTIMVISAFLILNIFLFNSIGGQLLQSTSIQSHGIIQTIGVAAYTNSACTIPMTEVDWGKIAPGQSSTNTFYVRNEGNSIMTLSLNTENWNPTEAKNYMTLNWNYAGQTISPNQTLQITLTLSVSQNIQEIDSFYFDIIIIGTS